MTSALSTTNSTTAKNDAADSDHGTAVAPVTETTLITTQGKTSIADVVVEKIAGMATREISGVYQLGGGAALCVWRHPGDILGPGREPVAGCVGRGGRAPGRRRSGHHRRIRR